MMITGTNPCYPNGAQGISSLYGVSEDVISSSSLDPNSSNPSPHPTSFLYNLSILKDKVHQIQSLASIFLDPGQSQPPESTTIAIPTMGTLIQEIIVTASSMMFACQQMALGPPTPANTTTTQRTNKGSDANSAFAQSGGGNPTVEERGHTMAFYSNHHQTVDHHHPWYGDNYNNSTENHNNGNNNIRTGATTHVPVTGQRNEICNTKGIVPHHDQKKTEIIEESQGLSPMNYDIVELDAADLLAKYTHYCQVCGKGFKRDANLRMHMRAHGDEYKSSAALSNPMKNNPNASGDSNNGASKIQRKYSCPHEGCRWNQKHAKFQPLKSMICVKNHYKRSHCPKMYVCKRCNRKQFSVLSDLRTHEKHCGDLKWQCSCGTTFSRKDKLMGHVALFVGHSPAINSLSKMGSATPMQMEDNR